MTIRMYDLCGAGDLRFSPYCARVRMAFALKGIEYETVPVAFTEIASIGAGTFKAVPVIEHDGKFIQDSQAIAAYLDETFPAHPVLPKDFGGRQAIRFIEGTMVGVLQLQAMPLVAKDIHDRVQEKDKAYFRESREKRLGRRLDDLADGRETRFAEYRRNFHPLRQVLAQGKWFGGDEPNFADAIVFGTFHWLTSVSDLSWFDGEDALADWFGRAKAIAG